MQVATRRSARRATCLFCSFRGVHTVPRRLQLNTTARPLNRISSIAISRSAIPSVRCQSTKATDAEKGKPAAAIAKSSASLYSAEDTRSYDRLFNAVNEKLFLQTTGENPKIPRESEVILAFKACQRLAASYPIAKTQPSGKSTSDSGSKGSGGRGKTSDPNDAILSLAGGRASGNGAGKSDKNNVNTNALAEPVPQSQESIEAEKTARLNAPVHPLMDMAYHIIIHPYIFISPQILTEYIKLAAILKDPSTLPSVLKLYATKPILYDPSKPAKKSRPNAAKNAIPFDTAKEALQVAISAKNMPLALEIIENTMSATAWCRKKGWTKLLPFVGITGAIPIGIYKLADWLAQFQEQWMHEKAMGYAFVGFMTYYICTGSLGLIALLTWNDHMIRVNWIPGVYMRERWFMEEQRALTDRVAMAWGYQEPYKRGLETGWEWEMLRHWAGVRGMIIDSSDMVEGREMSAEKEAERLAAQDSILARFKLKLSKDEKKKNSKRTFAS